MAAGLYGDGAIGGVVNFVTRRNYSGVEVEVGAQSTDKFDQHEEDVALTVGAGSEKTGINVMVSYFNRQPLAATDRDWIGERDERVKSLLGSPATLPAADQLRLSVRRSGCDIATKNGRRRRPRRAHPRLRSGRRRSHLLPADKRQSS